MADDPKQAAAATDQYTDALNKNSVALQNNNNILAVAKRYVDEHASAVNNLGFAWNSVSDFMKTLGSEVTDLQDNFGKFTDIIGNVVGQGSQFINILNLMPHAFSNMAQQAGTSLESVQQGLGTTLELAAKFPKLQPLTNWMASAQQGELLERSFIGLTGQAGMLNDVFDAQGKHLKDLEGLTSQYTQAVFDAANATGSTTQESQEFAAVLTKIPNLGEKFGTGQASLDALKDGLLLAKGAGVGLGEVENTLVDATNNLGNEWGMVTDNIVKGEALFARMSEVQQALGARFEDVRDILKDVAQQFRFLGNNTDSASQAIMRYSSALRDTGLTTKASLDITQKMIDNMAQLPQNIGTEAFLAQRTGMSGGLQGAMQMEMMMRQGKMGDVMRMAENALRQQFGGRIYTQAEAAQSPEATAQFMRQRMLLQSGAFGIGKGLENTQATHLLEALAKGDLGGAQKIAQSSQAAIKNVAEKGEVIQKSMDNEFKKANRNLEQILQFAKIEAFQALKQATGGEVFDRFGNLTSAAQDIANSADKAALAFTGKGEAPGSTQRYSLMRHGAIATAPTQDETTAASDRLHAKIGELTTGALGDYGRGMKGFVDMFNRHMTQKETPDAMAARDNASRNRFLTAVENTDHQKDQQIATRRVEGVQARPAPGATNVVISLSPGLEAKIVDKAKDSASNVIIKHVNAANQSGQ